jgi:prepilin-type N-terminal cleavage/methylation domain-containing protein
MNCRRGFTLIEMVVVITVSAVLMGIGTGILALLLRSQRLAHDDLDHGRSVARLAEQFRDDVHAATGTPQYLPDRSDWQWQLPSGRTVVYHLAPGVVGRREWFGAKLYRQESYALPAEVAARIEVSADPRSLACLLLDQPGGSQIRVEAVVRRDHRFSKYAPRNEP